MRKWDKSKPPRGPFTLNKDSDLARGLLFWAPLNGGGIFEADQAGNFHLNAGTSPTRTLDWAGAPAVQGNASSMYLARTSGIPSTALPLTLACWCRPTTLNVAGSFVFGFGTNAVQNETIRLYFDNSGNIYAQDYNVAVGNGAASKSGLTAGAWQHVAGVFSNTTSRTAYLNGAAGTANTTSVTHANLANISLGAWIATGSATNFMDGTVSEPAAWNRAFSTQEILELNDPSRRFELWYPLRSRKWIDLGGGTNGTASGATVTATASLIDGAASGVQNPTVSGQTLTATASLIDGGASAGTNGTAAGQTLTATASLIDGAASGVQSPTVAGQILTAIASLIAGSAYVPGTGGVARAPIGITAFFFPSDGIGI